MLFGAQNSKRRMMTVLITRKSSIENETLTILRTFKQQNTFLEQDQQHIVSV